MPSGLVITNVVSQLPSEGSNGRRLFADIKYAVVHHDAVFAEDTYDAPTKYAQEARIHIQKGWRHLAYHLRVARDGQVYQTVPFEEIGFHAGNYPFNKYGIGICLDGDLTKQMASGPQLRSLGILMRYLSNERPDIPNLIHGGFWAHKEVRGIGWPGTIAFIPNPTACPSKEIADLVKQYRVNGV